MMIALTRPSGTPVWIDANKIVMIEPLTAHGVGAVIHTIDKRCIEVRDDALDVLKLTDGE